MKWQCFRQLREFLKHSLDDLGPLEWRNRSTGDDNDFAKNGAVIAYSGRGHKESVASPFRRGSFGSESLSDRILDVGTALPVLGRRDSGGAVVDEKAMKIFGKLLF